MRVLILMSLIGCASIAPHRCDTPQFRQCRDICSDHGLGVAHVLEDEDSFQCFCKPAPLTTT